METYTRKKAIGGPNYSVRGGNLAFRDRNREDRQNSMMTPQTGRPEKTKFADSSVRSKCNKTLALGSSSRSLPSSFSKHAIAEQQERSSLEELSHGEESRFVRRPSLLSTGSSSRSSIRINQSNSRNREISLSSSLKRPVTSRSGSSRASEPVSHNLRNLGRNSVRKRLYERETSSSRAKSITASSGSGSVSHRSSAATSGLSRSEGSYPIQASRRGRNQTVRSQGARSLQDEASTSEAVSDSSSRSVPGELPPAFLESLGRRSSISRARRNWLNSRVEDRSSLMFPRPVAYRDGYRRLNIEDIAEQLLVLETNIILGRRSFYDRHRDMRMDIDNMTYEELLALEEKMGTVSTALSEEAITKCLQRSIYISDSSASDHTSKEADDTKCSICQEEFASGDEVGKLGCGHLFHVACVQHWLRLKNWCPICKASACPS